MDHGTAPARRSRRRAPWIVGGLGVVLAIAAVAWPHVAVPALVKYPTDLDVSVHYEGTFQLFADPETFAPLAQPRSAPLRIDRALVADGAESGASRVVIDETLTLDAGELLRNEVRNRYVMDRRDIVNVADPRAYAFRPDNPVDRSGAYRLHLPFDTEPDGTYPIYKNETGTTYSLVGLDERRELEGLHVQDYEARAEPAPLDPVYLEHLRTVVPLPTELTLAQLEPFLAELGIDVGALLAALLPVLNDEDRATLAGLAANPIALEYVLDFDGAISVEPTTGSELEVRDAVETLGARPGPAALESLDDLLGRYEDLPEARRALEVLSELAAGDPIPIAAFSYSQTPASVAEIAEEVKDLRAQIVLVERWIPLILAALALICLVVALLLWRRTNEPPPSATAGVGPERPDRRVDGPGSEVVRPGGS